MSENAVEEKVCEPHVRPAPAKDHRRRDQPDLFAGVPEPERKVRSYAPDPDDVRAHLRHILAQARAASAMPWDARKAGFYRTVVPQMTLWLPDEEAARWRLDFETEMARPEEAA